MFQKCCDSCANICPIRANAHDGTDPSDSCNCSAGTKYGDGGCCGDVGFIMAAAVESGRTLQVGQPAV